MFELLGPIAAGARILDIGSGQGELSIALSQHYPQSEVWGIEYSAEGVQRSVQIAASEGATVRFSQRDLLSVSALPPDHQDWANVAVCSEVLEHVDAPEVLLRNAAEYLAPGCKLVVTVPGGPRSAFDRYIGHRQHFTPKTLHRLLSSSGFRVDRTSRSGFPFFNLYRLAVIARGKKLIEDLRRNGADGAESRATSMAYEFFDRLFRWNLTSTPFGWQIVAVAHLDGPANPALRQKSALP